MPVGQEIKINDNATVPFNWLLTAIGATVTAFLCISGIIIWAVRLEARGDFQQNQVNKIELRQEEYDRHQRQVQESLVRLEVILKNYKVSN